MKNRTIFSSIVLAFLVSVFFMSVSTVFGANPTEQPPSGVVGPTFSSVTTGGLTVNGGASTINGSVIFTPGGQGVTVNGPMGLNSGSFVIDGGNLDINNGGDLTVDGTSIFDGDVTVSAGKVEVSTGNVTVSAGKVITNQIDAVVPHSTITVSSPVKFVDAPIFQSMPSFPNTVEFQIINLDQKMLNPTGNYAGKVFIDDDVRTGGNLSLGGDLSSYNDSDVNVSENLTVNGAVKATSFGTFYNLSSSLAPVTSGGTTVSKACNAGDIIVSCNFYSWQGVYVTKIEPNTSTNSCDVIANDPSNTGKKIQAIVRCFNPDGL